MRMLLAVLAAILGGCAAVGGETPKRPKGPFLASAHGFRFVNHFEGSPLPPSLRDSKGGSAGVLRGAVGSSIPSTFGLCGGMSLAAADFYHAGVLPPDTSTPPRQGTALYEYIYQRQVESLGEGGIMALAFYSWMSLPDEAGDGTSTSERTGLELPAIVARLENGEVLPLGLVLVRHPTNARAASSPVGKLWNNHQVLAYGVERRAGGVVDVRVYDPNYPGDDEVTVRFTPRTMAPGGPVAAERITGRGHVTPVRGAFPMPYEAHTPGADVRKQPGGQLLRPGGRN